MKNVTQYILGATAKRSSLAILLSVVIPLLSQGQQQKFDYIFEKGMNEYACFRIPAIIKTNNGTLLAFAEARKNGCSDTGDIDLVLRRSEDGGKTWGPMQVIWDDGENVCGNPAPLVERQSGTIFLLLTWNLGSDHERDIIAEKSKDTRRVYLTRSSDDGVSWQAPKEITATTKLENWTWYATGPVHGIQLEKNKQHKGRMVIPCDHIEAGTKHYYSHIIYSDDKGETWKLGGSTPQHQVNECAVAELKNGDLLLNMRNYDRNNKNRKVSISKDGGMSWSDLQNDPTLIEPICQGSLLSHKKHLYFSNPASKDSRSNMTVRRSDDNGKSWANKLVVYEGPSAYSDMVIINKRQLGLLYEGGIKSPYEGIAFEMIDLKELR